MINIKSKRCFDLNCTTQPTFGLETDSKATYCATHKLENMIDIKSKRCFDLNCTTQPIFGLETDSKATYCNTHKKE